MPLCLEGDDPLMVVTLGEILDSAVIVIVQRIEYQTLVGSILRVIAMIKGLTPKSKIRSPATSGVSKGGIVLSRSRRIRCCQSDKMRGSQYRLIINLKNSEMHRSSTRVNMESNARSFIC